MHNRTGMMIIKIVVMGLEDFFFVQVQKNNAHHNDKETSKPKIVKRKKIGYKISSCVYTPVLK